MKNQTVTQNHNLPSSRWLIPFVLLLTMTFNSCEVGDNPLPGPYLSSPVDQQFIINASDYNVDLTNAAQIALAISSTGSVKTFADSVENDHTAAETGLKQISQIFNFGIPFGPLQPDGPHQEIDSVLSTLSGPGFDTTYLRDQINDHQNAVALYQTEISSGSDSLLIAYANQYLPVLQAHLNLADSLIKVLE
jgi:putative membrane protein